MTGWVVKRLRLGVRIEEAKDSCRGVVSGTCPVLCAIVPLLD